MLELLFQGMNQGLLILKMTSNASGAICNLILNWIMIPLWGVNGAAIATLVTQLFTNFIVGFFFREIRENNFLILKAFCFWRYLN